MAIDSQQKRMSAVNPSCPWRGPMVDATQIGFRTKRAAADYMYSHWVSTGCHYGELRVTMKRFGNLEVRPARGGSVRVAPSQ